MRMLLIYPPQWNPASPYLSVPLLAGQLKAAGYSASALDLNVRFYNHILTNEHLTGCLKKARSIYSELEKTVQRDYPDAESRFSSYSVDEQTMLLKHRKLRGFLADSLSELERSDYSCGNKARYSDSRQMTLEEIIDATDEAVRVMKDKKDFYDPEKLFDAKMIIQEALKIASLPYAPNELIWDNYFANPIMKMDWENIDTQCRDSSLNMFIDFFEQAADSIADEDYDCVCISVPDLSQLIGAFTLSRILKKRTKAKIAVGGNYITQNKADFLRHPELFSDYADFLMTGDGEIAVVRLADHLCGKIAASDIPGIIFRAADGSLVCGGDAPKLRMNEIARACFDGYDFSMYFSPTPVMPLQLGKGCYWGKCTFCDYYYGQQCFDIKSTEQVLSDFRYYNETYGINHFMFIDEAVPPVYYDRLSEAIIKSGLEEYFFSFARLEKGFTPQVLSRMYRAGARMLMWGYECSAERLMDMMNKGVDTPRRLDIMRDAHEAGIWNNALFIIGFPTETKDEINNTLNIVKNNRDVINSCTPSNFSLKKNAIMAKQIGKNGVISCETNGEFYTVYKDRIEGVSQSERREIRRNFHYDYITENRRCLWPVVYSDFDHLLLYLAKYGLDRVASYRSERNICPMFR